MEPGTGFSALDVVVVNHGSDYEEDEEEEIDKERQAELQEQLEKAIVRDKNHDDESDEESDTSIGEDSNYNSGDLGGSGDAGSHIMLFKNTTNNAQQTLPFEPMLPQLLSSKIPNYSYPDHSELYTQSAVSQREDGGNQFNVNSFKRIENHENSPSLLNNASSEKSDISNYSTESVDFRKRHLYAIPEDKVLGGNHDAASNFMLFGNTQTTQQGKLFVPKAPTHNTDFSSEDINEAYRQADFNSVEQLQTMYEVRLHEIQRLGGELEAAKAQRQEDLRRMILLQAEKESAELTRSEADKLLVANKEEISRLQQESKCLQQKVADLEADKVKADESSEMLKVHIDDLEQRILLMERCDPSKSVVREKDLLVKQLKTRHQEELCALGLKTEAISKDLKRKEEEYNSVKAELSSLQRAHELLQVEKADTINQLSRMLEDSQEQCRQLMMTSQAVENAKLQNQLSSALSDNDRLTKTLKDMQAEYNDVTRYERFTKLSLPQSGSSDDETDSIKQMGISRRLSQTQTRHPSLNTTDNDGRLKKELHRTLLNQNAQRAEICRLQELTKTQRNELEEKEVQQKVLLEKLETVNAELNKVRAELGLLEEQKSNDRAEDVSLLAAELAELRKEKAVLERQNMEVQKKLNHFSKNIETDKKQTVMDNKEYLRFHDETVARVKKEMEEEHNVKIKEYSMRLEHSLKEASEVKEMYVAVCKTKDQLEEALRQARTQLKQSAAERDQVMEELQRVTAVGNQMARQLNHTQSSPGTGRDVASTQLQHAAAERDRLEQELRSVTAVRDQLAEQVNQSQSLPVLKKENEKLNAEIQVLKSKLASSSTHETENECRECVEVRARYAQELSAVRSELQRARERLVSLEQDTKAQLKHDTATKAQFKQDIAELRAKCDEKEVQIKKLIESRKRPPSTVSIGVETDERHDEQNVEEGKFTREMVARLQEEYNNALAEKEEAHQMALDRLHQVHQEELEMLKESHLQIMERVRLQLEKQGEIHRQELQVVEERTKDATVKFFAEKVRQMEANYMEQVGQRVEPAVIDRLQDAIAHKHKENENLMKQLEEQRTEMEDYKEQASKTMVQWAQELKNVEGELKLKEAMLDEQRSQIDKARTKAQSYRSKLIKTNENITSQFQSKISEFKSKVQASADEYKKFLYERFQKLVQIHEQQIQDLQQLIELHKEGEMKLGKRLQSLEEREKELKKQIESLLKERSEQRDYLFLPTNLGKL